MMIMTRIIVRQLHVCVYKMVWQGKGRDDEKPRWCYCMYVLLRIYAHSRLLPCLCRSARCHTDRCSLNSACACKTEM